MTHLVVATDYENNPMVGWISTYGLQGVNPEEVDWDRRDAYKKNEIWFCQEKDVKTLVTEMSKLFPGKDIKVFKLMSIFNRLPGDLKEKIVSKDGVLPK